MAARARLALPPHREQEDWPYHTAKCGSLPASALFVSERRMEAENYLSKGYGIRTAIEARTGWTSIDRVAIVTQPSRLKGILVSPENGTPFLAATQIFDARPIPRKFLALSKMAKAADCFVDQGTILVTRSGSVGRPTIAYKPHEGVVLSDDLLRVLPREARDRGWVYAFLHSAQARAMCTSAHYGHIIKHLEVSHLQALPLPPVDDETAEKFNHQADYILELRNKGHRLNLEAEVLFTEAVGPLTVKNWGEDGFFTSAWQLSSGRRRLEAQAHNPGVAKIRRHLAKNGLGVTPLVELGFKVWLPTRFRRIPAVDGVPLVESSALVEVNPDIDKRIADGDFGDAHRGRVAEGWVLVARSGQVYGINGTAVLATAAFADMVVSDDVLRISPLPGCEMRTGYLWIALSHPVFGRPVVKALAYGSSIPHIDPGDLCALGIVRLRVETESAVADLAEAAARSRAEADLIEQQMARDASEIIDRFILGA
jgi:hypothetical protein